MGFALHQPSHHFCANCTPSAFVAEHEPCPCCPQGGHPYFLKWRSRNSPEGCIWTGRGEDRMSSPQAGCVLRKPKLPTDHHRGTIYSHHTPQPSVTGPGHSKNKIVTCSSLFFLHKGPAAYNTITQGYIRSSQFNDKLTLGGRGKMVN